MVIGASLICCMEWSPVLSVVRCPTYMPSWVPAFNGTFAIRRRPPSTAEEVEIDTCLLSLATCACMNWRCGYIVGSLDAEHAWLIALKVSEVMCAGKGIDGGLDELNLKVGVCSGLHGRSWWVLGAIDVIEVTHRGIFGMRGCGIYVCCASGGDGFVSGRIAGTKVVMSWSRSEMMRMMVELMNAAVDFGLMLDDELGDICAVL
jgi:hypothetical protein